MSEFSALQFALDQSGKQIAAVFSGLDREALQSKPIPQLMSPYEQLEHLCECYQAYETVAKGGEYSAWGSYRIPVDGQADPIEFLLKARASAAIIAAADQSEEGVRHAFDYLVLHEAYHVGQMCPIRLALDPSWNAYSIY